MSEDLAHRVGLLEEKVGATREALAVMQTKQEHMAECLTRIETAVDCIQSSSADTWAKVLRHPQTLVILVAIIAGVFGEDTAKMMVDVLETTQGMELALPEVSPEAVIPEAIIPEITPEVTPEAEPEPTLAPESP